MINPSSINIDNKVLMNYDSRLEVKSTMIYQTQHHNFKLFGDYYGGDFNDFQVSNIIILICNLNTIESYWEELKSQILHQPNLHPPLQSILPNILSIQEMDNKHKSWFRDRKIGEVLS